MNLLKGNCLETLKTLDTASVDSIVTDPPYELSFMGKSWDNSGIAYSTELWAECLRVLKPGGHLLSFGGSRTYHRMACAIENAGFEIRDQIMWLYGSGFPKSLDVAKAINKTAGVEFEAKPASGVGFMNSSDDGYNTTLNQLVQTGESTDEAQQWQGWGTALKPAHEPIVVARKPLIGTVANNVLTYGTGALNIDGSRVGTTVETWPATRNYSSKEMSRPGSTLADDAETQSTGEAPAGRWPANVIHDGSDEVLAGFPITTSGNRSAGVRKGMGYHGANGDGGPEIIGDEGSAARFFYCAKASKSERNAGLEEGNTHPTVKPLALLRYLIKLVTPPNGVVLDPFLGSGTTAVAAILEGFEWTGCEMTEDYWPIIEARTEWAHGEFDKIVVQPELTSVR